MKKSNCCKAGIKVECGGEGTCHYECVQCRKACDPLTPEKKSTEELKILCPFCNAVYTAEMLEDLDAAGGCPTCSVGISGEIVIKCDHCKKIVYVKEI